MHRVTSATHRLIWMRSHPECEDEELCKSTNVNGWNEMIDSPLHSSEVSVFTVHGPPVSGQCFDSDVNCVILSDSFVLKTILLHKREHTKTTFTLLRVYTAVKTPIDDGLCTTIVRFVEMTHCRRCAAVQLNLFVVHQIMRYIRIGGTLCHSCTTTRFFFNFMGAPSLGFTTATQFNGIVTSFVHLSKKPIKQYRRIHPLSMLVFAEHAHTNL